MALFYYAEYAAQEEITAAYNSAHVDTLRGLVTEDIEDSVSDLTILAHNHEFIKIINGDRSDISDLHADLIRILSTKKAYDQIRLINTNGMEVLRINYNNGEPEICAEKDLQNKSDRYYFTETIILNEHQIYISPLDLNKEGETVEIPFKPMLRFATPVFDKTGRKQGIIVLNYLADNLLCHFFGKEFTQFFLINSDGYWIKGPTPEDEWGFMFEQRKEKAFSKIYPEEWKAILKNKSGQLTTDNGLFFFGSVDPPANTALDYSSSEKNGSALFALSHVTQNQLRKKLEGLTKRLLMLYLVSAVFMVIISTLLTVARVNKNINHAEREKMIKELQAALSEIKTLRGIIPICSYCKEIRDDQGAWQRIEAYISKHSDAFFSHGICPTCLKREFPDAILDDQETLEPDKRQDPETKTHHVDLSQS